MGKSKKSISLFFIIMMVTGLILVTGFSSVSSAQLTPGGSSVGGATQFVDVD
ncbi:MAG: hypothetical protein IIC50_20220, partial [Planctomycetes bacterium]|nr:hypothetical protein [Planctomycetota bacterium]